MPGWVRSIVCRALQLLLCGGWLPQADDAAVAALSRTQGLPRHGGDVDLGDTAGATPARLARLSAVPGIDRRTLARWRTWWRSAFTDAPFALVAKAALVPPLDVAGLPASLLDRFAGAIEQKLTALLRFLAPLTDGASAMRAF
jgi:hypothetical protein